MDSNSKSLRIHHRIRYILHDFQTCGRYGVRYFLIGLLFSFISDLGINTAHVRMIAAGGDKNEYNNALLFMKLILTAIYILVILTSVFIWTNVLHHGFESKYEYLSILVLIPYFISLPYVQANRAFFTGTMEAAKMSLPAIIESTVRLICIIILI
ncbi:MAG: oligosaccharide flippase family protein, partial [Thermoplasmatales archaeon]